MYLIISKEHSKSFTHQIKNLVCDPPETWHPYMQDPHKIIEMEYNELQKAKEGNDPKAYKHELLHLAAACYLASKY